MTSEQAALMLAYALSIGCQPTRRYGMADLIITPEQRTMLEQKWREINATAAE